MAMSKRQIVFLGAATLIALMTVMAFRNLVATPPAADSNVAAVPLVPTIEVLFAAKDLPTGTFIANGDVDWRTWPADAPQDGMLVKGKNSDADYIGAVVRAGLHAGEPIPSARILKAGEHGFLSAVLQPGMRAMSIKITPTSGVAGFVFPNDSVDVILAHEVQRQDDNSLKDRRVAETVLENVRVLALDQKTDDHNNEPKVAELATLEVSPKQAEKLALVAQMGNLSLVLRSLGNAPAPAVEPALAKDNGGIEPQLIEAVSHALPAPMPVTDKMKREITWDSDVSDALPAPSDKNATEHKVQIYRGSTASDITFGGR